MPWLAAIVFSFGLFAVAEWASRRAIRAGRPFLWPPGRRLRLLLDRETHPQLEPVVRHVVNELGERGRPLPRRGKIHRTLVVGGSAAECYLLDQDTQWPAVLEARLRTPEVLRALAAEDAHVGNLGRSGMDSGSLEVFLSRLLPYYRQLDVIIVMVGASDVLRWLEVGAPPERPAPVLSAAELFAQRPEMELGWSPRRWGTTELVRRVRLHFWDTQHRAVQWMGRARQARESATSFLETMPEADVITEAFSRQFRAVLEHCQAHADRVLVLRQGWFEKPTYEPAEEALFWSGAVGRPYRGAVTAFYSHNVICALIQRIDAAAGDIADDMHMMHLRLQDAVTPSAENYIDRWHPTPAGSRQIGELAAQAVLSGLGACEERPLPGLHMPSTFP